MGMYCRRKHKEKGKNYSSTNSLVPIRFAPFDNFDLTAYPHSAGGYHMSFPSAVLSAVSLAG